MLASPFFGESSKYVYNHSEKTGSVSLFFKLSHTLHVFSLSILGKRKVLEMKAARRNPFFTENIASRQKSGFEFYRIFLSNQAKGKI